MFKTVKLLKTNDRLFSEPRVLVVRCYSPEENSAYYAPVAAKCISSLLKHQSTESRNRCDAGRNRHTFIVDVGRLGWEAVAACGTVIQRSSLLRSMGKGAA